MFEPHGQPLSLLISLLLVAVLALARNRRPRRLRIEWLWVRPALFILLMGATLVGLPPPLTPVSALLLGAGLSAGCVLGWQRGRFMLIDVDPETHALSLRASPIGVVFIVALVAFRYALSGVMRESAATLHLPVLAITDALVLLTGGLMAAQGLEMWLRARRLLAQAVAAKAARRAD
jgi:hypothetical protein